MIAVGLALGTAPAKGADDPLLARLVGEWIGNGEVRLTPKAAPERVYCRIVATLVEGALIEQKGRCVVASNSRAVNATISAKGDGHYEGTFDAPNIRSTVFAGTAEGDNLTLSGDFVDTRTKEERKATMTMQIAEAAYRVTTDNAGANDSYVASNIVFRRKEKP
ncbi:MAG: hypothetical protein ABI399_03620 [Bauldia sp.]